MKHTYKKIAAVLAMTACSAVTHAGYTAYYPLEVQLGGTLPNGSIIIGDGGGSTNPTDPTGPTDPTDPNDDSKCEFSTNPVSMMVALKAASSPFSAGDIIIMYQGRFIGAQSPSNGLTPPSGLTNGEMKSNSSSSMEFELCGTNLASYPTLPMPTGTAPEQPSKPVTFSQTITYNECEEARRVGIAAWGTDSCRVGNDNLAQTVALTVENTTAFTIWTDFLTAADKQNILGAKSITSDTGKSCQINFSNGSVVRCDGATMVEESRLGQTITFTIK